MLNTFTELTFLAAALALFVPALVFTVECLAAWLPSRKAPQPEEAPSGETSSDEAPGPLSIVVLMPAHNEEAGITETLTSIKSGLGDSGRILVVADNCDDATADRAREGGAEVIERNQPEARGKGYALAFGLEHLNSAPPDVVIVMDADCRTEANQLHLLAQKAQAFNRPVQAEYLLQAPENPTPKSRVSAFAVVVKNRVRALGLHRLNLPVPLAGSGMAFPWEVLKKAPPTGAYLVEDMLMGLELARAGHAPRFVPEVSVTSVLPNEDSSGQKQRRRWEHGHLQTIMTLGVPVTAEGIRKGSRDLFAMGLDLLVPPMAFLVVLLVGAWAVSGLFSLMGFWGGPYSIIKTSLTIVAFAVFTAWIRFGRDVLPFEHLISIPKYIAWKIPLYFSFLSKGSHQSWERTERESPITKSSESAGD